MPFWQLLVLAVVPSLAAVASAYLGFRDLGLRRRLETSRQFVTLFAAAHGRPVDGRDKPIGVGEQVATIHLIADFAAKEKVLVNAAVAGLRNLEAWDRKPENAPPVDMSALDGKMPTEQIEALRGVFQQAADSSNSESLIAIASAARAGLARLEPKIKPGHQVSIARPKEGDVSPVQ